MVNGVILFKVIGHFGGEVLQRGRVLPFNRSLRKSIKTVLDRGLFMTWEELSPKSDRWSVGWRRWGAGPEHQVAELLLHTRRGVFLTIRSLGVKAGKDREQVRDCGLWVVTNLEIPSPKMWPSLLEVFFSVSSKFPEVNETIKLAAQAISQNSSVLFHRWFCSLFPLFLPSWFHKPCIVPSLSQDNPTAHVPFPDFVFCSPQLLTYW